MTRRFEVGDQPFVIGSHAGVEYVVARSAAFERVSRLNTNGRVTRRLEIADDAIANFVAKVAHHEMTRRSYWAPLSLWPAGGD